MKRTLSIIILLICFIACTEKQRKPIEVAEPIQIDKSPGECPYLTKDNKDHVVLSWVRIINDSTTAFCYAVSANGKTFSDPVVLPNSSDIQPHGENLPKIVFKPSGEIIALWGAANSNAHNKYSGLVWYTQSFDSGKTWTTVRPLVTDTASYDQRYYDIAVLPNGEVGVIWLDNRKTTTSEGSGLYFASTDGRNGFQNERLISESCCQCCRTDLYVDRKGGIHALYRGIIHDSIRDMVHTVSTDGGDTFSEPQRINEDNWVLNACPHTGPSMTDNEQGIHFAWFTGGLNKGCHYIKSTDDGKTFVMYDSVTAFGSHPQMTALPAGEIVIVWDEARFVGNKTGKRIGIQTRTAEGKTEGHDYITAEDVNASYPVIAAINETSSFVAYSTRTGDKVYVNYQVVSTK